MLVVSTGTQWIALQTVAWTAMLADNLHAHSVAESVTRTFDGKHPCCLCKAIAAAKKSGRKNEGTPSVKKLEFPPVPENVTLARPSHFRLLPMAKNAFAEFLAQKPPVPPPRGSAV